MELTMNSCVNCKYLYQVDDGYSNYTVLNTYVLCAKERNENLISGAVEAPSDWNQEECSDNWPATQNARCELYAKLPETNEWPIQIDCDHEYGPADFTKDEEAIAAICQHSGLTPHGRRKS
jgi:hypothetical protein